MFEVNNWITAILIIWSSMLLINYASWKLEDELNILWKKLKIHPSIRWATFDAISSSLPEFITAMMWLILLKEAWIEIWLGTISWSAIFNILIIPFCSLLVYKGTKIVVSRKWIKRDVVFYLISIMVLLIGLFTWELFIMWFSLISVYMIYLIYLYKNRHWSSDKKQIEKDAKSVKGNKVSYFTILIALILTFIAVHWAINAAQFVGINLWIPTIIVALVLLAWITSIPDTFLSMKSAQKGDIDASLSNAVGSNIFDVCIWLWVPIVIWIGIMWLDPKVDFFTNIPIFIFLVVSVFVYLFVLLSKKITKKSWYLLLFMYIMFIVLLYFLI